MIERFIVTDICRVVFVGKDEYPNRILNFSGRPLPGHELIYHFSGKSTVQFNGTTLFVEENTVRFLPKGENREYIVEKEENGECIDVCFDTNIPLSDEAFTIKAGRAASIGSMFKKLFTTWVSKREEYYFECLALLYKIFAELQKKKYIPQNQSDTIQPAIALIEKNFLGSKISVPDLAARCGISETYLKKLFIKKFGVPPKKYSIQLKINHACDLLRFERYSITKVAELCGYENVYYFSRQFKEYVGTSPSVFIKKYQSSK